MIRVTTPVKDLFAGMSMSTELLQQAAEQLTGVDVVYNYNLPVGKVLGVRDGMAEISLDIAAIQGAELDLYPSFTVDADGNMRVMELSIH